MRRWLIALTAGLAALTGGGGVRAQVVSPGAAPAEWVAYAEAANTQLKAWLAGDYAPAVAAQAQLDALRPSRDVATPSVIVRLWIGPDGRVDHLETTPPDIAAPGAPLHALILGRQLAPPPKAMLQPLRLALRLEPDPPPAATPPTSN